MEYRFEHDGIVYEGPKKALHALIDEMNESDDIIFVSEEIKVTYPLSQKEIDRRKHLNGTL